MPKREKKPTDLEALEAAAKSEADAHYVFRLFVTGSTPHSASAIVNVRRFCEEKLAGRFKLKITDLVAEPAVAAKEQIFVTPTLIRDSPLPQRRFVGNMSRLDWLLVVPSLEQSGKKPTAPESPSQNP